MNIPFRNLSGETIDIDEIFQIISEIWILKKINFTIRQIIQRMWSFIFIILMMSERDYWMADGMLWGNNGQKLLNKNYNISFTDKKESGRVFCGSAARFYTKQFQIQIIISSLL